MTSRGEKDVNLRSASLSCLESPFLKLDLFAKEAESEGQPHLEALISRSPFTHSFEGIFKERLELETYDENTIAEEQETEIFSEQARESEGEDLEGRESAFEEEIIGNDDRTPVTDALVIPNRWICAIDILSDKPGLHSRATGILIGPRYVLTAKHIWDDTFKELTVSPGRNKSNSKNPFGKVKAKGFRFPEPYYIDLPLQHGKSAVSRIKQDDDYMLIILKEDLASTIHSEGREVLGYWGQNPEEAVVRILKPEVIQGKEIEVIGYPGDTCGTDKFSGSTSQKLRAINDCLRTREYEWASRQWRSTGILDVRSNIPSRMYHTADTYHGQSGAPIWLKIGHTSNLIGIHLDAESAQRNLGLRVTERMLRNLSSWINEDAGYTMASIKDDTLMVHWAAEKVPKVQPVVQQRIALEIPYRWICRLEVYENDLGRVVGYGTGLLISDRHVLTSARVVYSFSKDRRKYSIRIAPGYEFGKEALGSTTASRARISPKFSLQEKDASQDYGLLTLSRPLGSATFSSIGNVALGSWSGPAHGLSTSAAEWSGKAAHSAAFSRSSGGGGGYHKLRVAPGSSKIIGLLRGQLLHSASSKLDAPGAPIWVESEKRRLLVAIASSVFSKDSDVNRGCYLSQETLSLLMQWINEDFEQREIQSGEQFSQDEVESLLDFSESLRLGHRDISRAGTLQDEEADDF